MKSHGVGKVTATLNRIRGLCDSEGNITDSRLLQTQRRWWSEFLWMPVGNVKLFFRKAIPDHEVRAHDARFLRETGTRLPLGIRALLRWHNGIVIAAFDDNDEVLGSFEVCSARMIEAAPIGETPLLPVFWDYDDFPSSTHVYAVDLSNYSVVAVEPPTFGADRRRRQVATSFLRWLDDFFCRYGATPDCMPAFRTLTGEERRIQTNVGVGPSESSLTRLRS